LVKQKTKKQLIALFILMVSNGIWAQTNCARVDGNVRDELDLKLSAQ
jgi:hypothetical protein